MKIKLIGLGKMGLNIAQNMVDHGHEVLGYAPSEKTRTSAIEQGISVAHDYETLLKRDGKDALTVWLLVPNGVVNQVIGEILPFLQKGDLIIDGGNSNFNASITRHGLLKREGIEFIDLGTSGGTKGARYGANLMAGGEPEAIARVEQVFKHIAAPNGYAHVGGPGAGHFVKMVHNGIEYGMMQAIGEGFDLMKNSSFKLDHKQIANLWNHGSIIESALIGNVADALTKSPSLSDLVGRIDDSGEGMWMIEEALKSKVSVPVIALSLFARYKSKDDLKYGEKVVAAMRNEFGGHTVYKKDE